MEEPELTYEQWLEGDTVSTESTDDNAGTPVPGRLCGACLRPIVNVGDDNPRTAGDPFLWRHEHNLRDPCDPDDMIDPADLIRELLAAVGMGDGPLPALPRQAWEEAINRVRGLVDRPL